MRSAAEIVASAIEERIAKGHSSEDERYISASSLSHGCMQYVARELLGFPKPELEPRVKRILEVGREGHRRIERYLRRISLAHELLFRDEEYRIKGYCDDLVYIPPERSEENSGFYAVEIKTISSAGFERVVDRGEAREDHARQCLIYQWGIKRYYRGEIPIRGGVVLYEDRDTLEHALFDVPYDQEGMEELLSQVEALWEALEEGQIPEEHLEISHWYHRYCPYLDICPVGQEAIRWQREHREGIPDEVLARIIGERVLASRRKREKEGRQRSLAELAEDLGWE